MNETKAVWTRRKQRMIVDRKAACVIGTKYGKPQRKEHIEHEAMVEYIPVQCSHLPELNTVRVQKFDPDILAAYVESSHRTQHF